MRVREVFQGVSAGDQWLPAYPVQVVILERSKTIAGVAAGNVVLIAGAFPRDERRQDCRFPAKRSTDGTNHSSAKLVTGEGFRARFLRNCGFLWGGDPPKGSLGCLRAPRRGAVNGYDRLGGKSTPAVRYTDIEFKWLDYDAGIEEARQFTEESISRAVIGETLAAVRKEFKSMDKGQS